MKPEPLRLPKTSLPKVRSLQVVTGNACVRMPLPARKLAAPDAREKATPAAAVEPAPKVAGRPPALKRGFRDGCVPTDFFSKRYRLLKKEGQGDAVVFKAWDGELEMPVALKFIPSQCVRNQETLAQLKQEATIALRLTHENIVRLHTVDFKSERPFMVMEYVAGGTLRDVLKRKGRLSVASMLAMARSCVEALAYAHERGVLHRDIKPENIMLTPEGVLKLVDFGTAAIIESAPGSYIEGTPGYMAPEQVTLSPLDARADVFGLSAVLWELLTGWPAFSERKDLNRMYEKPPEHDEVIPGEVAAVLRKGMALAPAGRWSTILEFGDALMKSVPLSEADLEAGRTAVLG